MPFQAYLDTIERETGKAPADLRACAAEKGWVADGALRPEVKAGVVIAELKQSLGLGHGHAMAVFALLPRQEARGRSLIRKHQGEAQRACVQAIADRLAIYA